jgi:8-amino-7-oxononanoate synthase
MREGLAGLGAKLRGSGHVIPWILGDAKDAVRLANALQARGVEVRAIRPPSVPPGTARLRFSVTAAHQTADIERAVDAAMAAQRETMP